MLDSCCRPSMTFILRATVADCYGRLGEPHLIAVTTSSRRTTTQLSLKPTNHIQQPLKCLLPPLARLRIPPLPLLLRKLGRLLHPRRQIPTPRLTSLFAPTHRRPSNRLDHVRIPRGPTLAPGSIPRETRLPADSIWEGCLRDCSCDAEDCCCAGCS